MSIGTNIPVKLYEVLIPVLINILDDLAIQISDLALKSAIKNIQSTIEGAKPCNDLELQNLADKINKLKQLINNFLTQLNKIRSIANILQTISAAAKAISAYLTASGTPIAPAGLVKALQIISSVGTNAASVAKLLSNILTQISVQLNLLIDKLNLAINQLNRACSDLGLQSYPRKEIVATETNTGFLDKGIIESGTATATATGQIPDSVFYRSVNVSDDDLTERIDAYESLLNRQVDLLTGIKEAPSDILSGTSDPITTDGYPGDYFINTVSSEIFGPKSADNQWN